MTIGTYHFTFGFKIKLIDYLAARGYTIDIVPDAIWDNYMNLNDSPDRESVCELYLLQYWFSIVQYGEDDEGCWYDNQVFTIDNVEFVARSFLHSDKDDYDINIIIGVDISEIDRWTGITTIKSTNPSKDIRKLVNIETWRSALQNGNRDRVSFEASETNIPDPEDTTCFINAEVWSSTDDCDCCS